jgi:hypothetical protein
LAGNRPQGRSSAATISACRAPVIGSRNNRGAFQEGDEARARLERAARHPPRRDLARGHANHGSTDEAGYVGDGRAIVPAMDGYAHEGRRSQDNGYALGRDEPSSREWTVEV